MSSLSSARSCHRSRSTNAEHATPRRRTRSKLHKHVALPVHGSYATGAYQQTAGRRGDSTLVFSKESRERLEAIVQLSSVDGTG